jgi:hypothetical protein
MDQILRLNEFFVEGDKKEISHVLLNITEPEGPEEAKKGYFFALSETNNASVSFIAKFQDIIDRASTEYYEIPSDADRDAFELVLEKMNGEAFVLEHEQGELNSIVGAIREKEIIFSYYGNPQLLLFYRNKLGGYDKMDLVKSSEKDLNVGQMFSQVIQGKLTPNDYLFVGTPHIVDFFSHDRLEKIITTRTAEESAEHLKKVLGELKNGFSFGGLIIHLFRQEQKNATKNLRPPAGSSSQSLQNLFTREKNTTNTLSPSILPKLDRLRGILNNTESATLPTQKPVGDFKGTEIKSAHLNTHRPKMRAPAPNYGDYIVSASKIIWSGIKIVGKFIFQILYLIYAVFYNIFRTIILLFMVAINYKNRRNTIIENWRMAWRGRREDFRHLPLLTKFMLFGSVIIALFFAISLLIVQHNRTVATENTTFDNSLREFRSTIASIESAIIYKNDELAYTDYKKATEMLSGIICKSANQKSICEGIKNELSTLGIKLRKITIANVSELATFIGLPNAGTEGMIRAKNKLIAYSSTTSTLYIYDLLSGELKSLPTYPSIAGFSEATVPKENDYVLFLYNKKQLMRLDTADWSVRLAEISFSSDKSEINSFAVYNRRLYALDSTNNTILRHDSIKTGFGQGQEWLKDKSVSVQNGTDLTIDGDVFITKSDGNIVKFTSGVPQPFSLTGLDPVLASASEAFTYLDIPYLYILEPTQKRLIIFEKNGHFVGQYASPTFVSPSGFSIDYPAKTAYILDSGKLLKFPLK